MSEEIENISISLDYLLEEYFKVLKTIKAEKLPENLGNHIYFSNLEKFKKVKGWYDIATKKTDGYKEENFRNLIQIFTTASKKPSLDYQIREKYDVVEETNKQLISANQQGGSFTSLIKAAKGFSKDTKLELDKMEEYMDVFIDKLKNSYDENYRLKFKERGTKENWVLHSKSSVGKELEFLLNFEKDIIPLKNSCYYNALGIIKEVEYSGYTYKGKQRDEDKDDEIIDKIIRAINQIKSENTALNSVPSYYLLDQIFNVLDKIKEDDIPSKNPLDPISESLINFYDSAYKFNLQSKHYRSSNNLLESLVSGKNTILYGPPGTGKTYEVMQFLKDFNVEEDSDTSKFIIFHPNYTYEDFIDGVKAVGIRNGNIQLSLVNGHLKQFCIDVHAKNKALIEEGAVKKTSDLKKYYFIVDEINRANLSAVFGETLMLLESSYRYQYFEESKEDIDTVIHNKKNNRLITLQNSGIISTLSEDEQDKVCFEKIEHEFLFGIPENIYFIGMMNDVDKSIDAFDLALRRRFSWIYKGYDKDVVENELKAYEIKEGLKEFISGIDALNYYINVGLGLGMSYEFGHSFFLKIKEYTSNRKIIEKKTVESLFENNLKQTLKEYLRSVYSENELEQKLKEAQDKLLIKFKK